MQVLFTANDWQANEDGYSFEVTKENNGENIIQVFRNNDDGSASPIGVGIGIYHGKIVIEGSKPFTGYIVIL